MDFYSRLFAGGLSGGGDELFKLVVSGNLTVITEEMFDGITTIVNYAFYDCTSLTSVTIPNSVTTIGDLAFDNCTSLTSVTIPEGVTTIEFRAFSGCTSLTSIEIPSSVTSMGSWLFWNCTSLTSVTVLANTPPTLGPNVFENTHSSLKIYVPSGSVNAYKRATNWKSYSSKIYAI